MMIKNIMEQISYNLQEAGFIKLVKDWKKPLTNFKGDDWNNKVINFEEAMDYLPKGNVGLVCGVNDFICIDCDGSKALELSQAIEGLLPRTYSETTTSGGYHYFFRIKGQMENLDIKSDGIHYGELRCNRQYVVIAPSKAWNKQETEIGEYKVLNDYKVPYVTKEQIKEVLFRFMKPEEQVSAGKLTPELLQRVVSDEEIRVLFQTEVEKGLRSEKEQELVNKLVARNFTKEEIFQLMPHSKTGKWLEAHIKYRELTFKKAVSFVTNPKKEVMKEVEPLECWTISDYNRYKPRKDYIIKDFMYPKQICMTYGQTGHMKSIDMLYKALCIATGKKYLGKKTKKQNVLILSAENSVEIDKQRIEMMMKGLKIRKKNIPLYIVPRNLCGDVLDFSFKLKLFKLIQDLDIKVLFLDTINPLTPELDDNRAKDVTRLFNELLKYIADEFNCYVSFLHHTDKQGRGFLGSTKFKANCDEVLRIERGDTLKPFYKIFNEKNRTGENNTQEVQVAFSEKKIEFRLFSESAPQIYKKNKKMSQQEFFIMKLDLLIKDKQLSRAEIMKTFDKNDIKYSTATLDRAIKEWRG